MNEAESGKSKDRRLGDEWSDWKGEDASRESAIDEKQGTFFLLSLGVVFIFVLLVSAGWYLVKPRVEQLHPLVLLSLRWSVLGSLSLVLCLFLLEGFALLKLGKSLLPYRWTERLLLFFLPKTIWLGAKFGISRDRVGNSFIKVNNFLTRCCVSALQAESLLVLLPRCLKKEARSEIIDRINGDPFRILTAGGGEEAREAIRKYRPTFILALACERDLMSGLRDVAEKIPVLAIPNRRPEGPCKNTHVSLGELDEALRFIQERMRANRN
ncbi:MAG: DUF116 domain-containing protein [Nitrospirae bacterium]|nr:DUF116 domain-containing protein [Nitrospirota bacterium]